MKVSRKHKWGELTNKYGKKITDIAKDEGVTVGCIHHRIRIWGSPYLTRHSDRVKQEEIAKWGKSIEDIAKDEGVGVGTIRTRIEEFADPYRSKRKDYMARSAFTKKYGKKITDIAKDEGVSRTQIYNRIEKYGTPYKAEITLINPIVKEKRYTKKPNKYIIKWGKTLADIAKDEGVHEDTIRGRIRKHGTPFK